VENFRIRAIPADGYATLVMSGEADLAVAPDLVELGTVCLDEPSCASLIIDLGAVTFIDSTSIGAMIQLHNRAEDLGKSVALIHLPNRVRQVLTLAGLDTFFGLTSAAPEAIPDPAIS
jgi:anti-sigma B factor antagonist